MRRGIFKVPANSPLSRKHPSAMTWFAIQRANGKGRGVKVSASASESVIPANKPLRKPMAGTVAGRQKNKSSLARDERVKRIKKILAQFRRDRKKFTSKNSLFRACENASGGEIGSLNVERIIREDSLSLKGLV